MALKPHAIDKVIGDKKRPIDDVLKDLVGSQEFYSVVARSVEASKELEPGIMGPSFSQQVRMAIAKDLANEL